MVCQDGQVCNRPPPPKTPPRVCFCTCGIALGSHALQTGLKSSPFSREGLGELLSICGTQLSDRWWLPLHPPVLVVRDGGFGGGLAGVWAAAKRELLLESGDRLRELTPHFCQQHLFRHLVSVFSVGPKLSDLRSEFTSALQLATWCLQSTRPKELWLS